MAERSMPEVPDLNARYRAERAMRDLTWGQGRTMPPAPQMAQPSYRDMSLDGARAQWDRMHDRVAYEDAPAQSLIREPFQQPQVPVQQPQHRAENDIEGILIAVAVVAALTALAPVARRAAVRFQALPAKQKMIVILGVVAVITGLLFI